MLKIMRLSLIVFAVVILSVLVACRGGASEGSSDVTVTFYNNSKLVIESIALYGKERDEEVIIDHVIKINESTTRLLPLWVLTDEVSVAVNHGEGYEDNGGIGGVNCQHDFEVPSYRVVIEKGVTSCNIFVKVKKEK